MKIEPSCPLCTQELHSQEVTPVSANNFIDMLNDLPIKCLGCKQTELKRMDFDAHYNRICPKTSIKCPSSDIAGCLWKGTREELGEHLKICIINLIKPLIVGLQDREQLEDWINQLLNQNEMLRNENQQLKKGGNKLRTPNVGPLKADHSLYDKGNDQQTRISAYLKGSKQVIGEKDLQKILNKLNQYQYETEIIFKDYKKIQIDFKALQEENQQLTGQLKQKLENSTNKLPSKYVYSGIHKCSYKFINFSKNNCSHLEHTFDPSDVYIVQPKFIENRIISKL
jgi:regulator of replication initiation timing